MLIIESPCRRCVIPKIIVMFISDIKFEHSRDLSAVRPLRVGEFPENVRLAITPYNEERLIKTLCSESFKT
jgi:hypothetical protein